MRRRHEHDFDTQTRQASSFRTAVRTGTLLVFPYTLAYGDATAADQAGAHVSFTQEHLSNLHGEHVRKLLDLYGENSGWKNFGEESRLRSLENRVRIEK